MTIPKGFIPLEEFDTTSENIPKGFVPVEEFEQIKQPKGLTEGYALKDLPPVLQSLVQKEGWKVLRRLPAGIIKMLEASIKLTPEYAINKAILQQQQPENKSEMDWAELIRPSEKGLTEKEKELGRAIEDVAPFFIPLGRGEKATEKVIGKLEEIAPNIKPPFFPSAESLTPEIKPPNVPSSVSPSGTPSPEFPFGEIKSEYELLNEIKPLIQESYEKELAGIGPKPEFRNNAAPTIPKGKIHDEVTLERDVGNIINPYKAPHRTYLSNATRSQINSQSENAAKNFNQLYDDYEHYIKGVTKEEPEMINQLKELIKKIDLAKVPSTVENDIKRIAKAYIKSGIEGKKLKPIKTESLVAQIKSNNRKINHDYVQGRPSNAYLQLNEILGDAIEKSATISSNAEQAIALNNQARAAYKQWVKDYGNSTVLKWRDPANRGDIKLLKQIENIDELKYFEDLLSKTEKGKKIYQYMKRDYIENAFKPFIKDPRKINSIEYHDLMREIKPITTPKERTAIEYKLEEARQPYGDLERQHELYEKAKVDHETFVEKEKKELEEYKAKIKEIKEGNPYYKNERALLRDMKTEIGMRKINAVLNRTGKGRNAIEGLKKNIGLRLMTEGKIIPTDTTKSLQKILNNVDDRKFVEYLFGKEVADDLRKIVNNISKVDAKVKGWKKALKIARVTGKLIPGVRGHVATMESLYDLYSMWRPAILKGDYSAIDTNMIGELINNRKEFLP